MAEVTISLHAFDFNPSLSAFQVERLYVEEERWEGEAERLREEADQLREQLSREVKAAQEEVSSFLNSQMTTISYQAEREREQHQGEEERLVESVRVLTMDNDRLLQEREREKANNSRSYTELKQEFEGEVTRLKASISCLQAELEVELTAREEAEAEAEKLASETDKLEEQVEEARKEAREQVRQVKSSLDTKLAQLEKRAEKLAAENFELTMDNEEMSKKTKVTQESLRKMEREVGQVQVEKEWLISQQKKAAGTSEKAGELAVQLDQAKTELREEKTKVEDKSQSWLKIQFCAGEESCRLEKPAGG